MASQYETAALSIQQIIETEFATENFKAIHDHLHESMGQKRVSIGISPIRKTPMPRNQAVNQLFVKVQFYDIWKREINPETQVNPFRITGFEERLSNALERAQATVTGTNDVWYFRVQNSEFPHDPTGNKTRFEMTVTVFGDNAGLMESRA